MLEIDIWRTAKIMVDQYGDDAPIIAAQRIDALLDLGDLDGMNVWKRVAGAIEHLMSGEKPPGVTEN